MSRQNETLFNVESATASEQADDLTLPQGETSKKVFVEPEISVPVDVLEATTFFQDTGSGGTN